MKVLVLGSAGQIGTRLCKVLRRSGHEVVEWDIVNSTTLRDQDLRYTNATLTNEIYEADFVMFLAFDVGGSTYLKTYEQTKQFVDNNVDIMRNTFQALGMANTPFIFASSQMSNMSYSTYGVLKALGESYTHILGGKVVKFWNVYDLETDPEKFHVITDFIISARDHGVINGKTNGWEERQFLHGEDASRALIVIMEDWETIPENELHITSFYWTPIRDVAHIISHCYDGVEITFSDQIDSVQLDKRNEPNSAMLKYWSPEISLIDGITKIIDGMQNEI